MIQSIHLTNWRSHANTHLIFHKGTNLLVGIMGAGKSSILEAISFSLFGTFPAIERRKLKIENIVRLNEPSAKIILEFEWEGGVYRVERTIEKSKKGSSSTAEIYKNQTLVEHGQAAVTSYIQNLIGLDYDLFTRAVYSEQNNIDHFLNLDPKKRREEIDALLGLDRFETARANVVTVINQIRSKRQIFEEKFNKTEIQELESTTKKHQESVSLAESQLKEIVVSYEQKNTDLQIAFTLFTTMKADKEKFDELDRDLLRFSTQSESLKKELENKTFDGDAQSKLEKKLTASTEEKTKFLTKLRTIDGEQAKISKEIGSLEAKLKSALQNQQTIASLEVELSSLLQGETSENLLEKQKGMEQQLLSMQSEKKSTENELADINDLIPKLRTGLSKCPLCSSDLNDLSVSHIKTEKENLIRSKTKRIAELSDLVLSVKKSHETLSNRIRKSSFLAEKISSLKKENINLEDIDKAKKKFDGDLISLNDEKILLQTTIENLNSDLESIRQELTSTKNLMAKKTEFDHISIKINETKTKLSTIKFDNKSFEEIRTKTEQLRLEVERILSSKKTIQAEIQNSNEMLRVVCQRLESIKSLEKDILALAKLEEELSIYKNALLDTQTSLRLNLIEAINSAMNEIWSIFYPYKNYHALRLGVSEKDYVFEVHDGNDWKSLETIASGGERACAALALRVAFAMVLTPSLSWLILDEPTHNLDSEAVELLSSALQYKVPEVVKQTFIITHDEGFMGSEFASSYRFTRDKSRNGETKIDSN
ncbi:DNA double-strand break repair Rad50 ATPase [Candidatus Bilamarchaeum dharawalense]|uniref:DNA double-strand break repair Rad50 ATPase n=1 Tax=Candidatus Bilamarchaeum dharawalense TaxID=2885759 RepID=A0A5E4LTG8_9ARCH|nr:DNA double-strand break repair Rad50 ATPase [Candidatus Bilamarchaeum dharawalense]